jgi:hypothetical protein
MSKVNVVFVDRSIGLSWADNMAQVKDSFVEIYNVKQFKLVMEFEKSRCLVQRAAKVVKGCL